MKPLYYILILLIINIGLVYGVLMPLYSGEASSFYQPDAGYKNLKQQLLDYDASLAKAQEVILQAKKIQQDYANVSPSDIELLKTMVPDDINEVKLRSEVSGILTDSGFPVDKMSVVRKGSSPVVLGADAYTVTVSLEDSSYERLKAFLNVLERSKRIFAVKSVSVQPGAKVGDVYKFDISTETYYINNQNKK